MQVSCYWCFSRKPAVITGFPSQRVSHAESVFMSWCYRVLLIFYWHVLPNDPTITPGRCQFANFSIGVSLLHPTLIITGSSGTRSKYLRPAQDRKCRFALTAWPPIRQSENIQLFFFHIMIVADALAPIWRWASVTIMFTLVVEVVMIRTR